MSFVLLSRNLNEETPEENKGLQEDSFVPLFSRETNEYMKAPPFIQVSFPWKENCL
jgi:hypothetical protein